MSVEIREVSSPRERRTFINYPYELFRGSPYWVPPLLGDEEKALDPRRNPAFDHSRARLWLAWKDGQVAGRIAGILNGQAAGRQEKPCLRFGWFDLEDDPGVARGLLAAVEGWARQEGLAGVHGPLGFTDMDRAGMLVEGFAETATMITLYNPPYYPQHMEALGYRKDMDWVEYEIRVPPEPVPNISRLAETVLRRYGLRVLQVRHKSEMLPYGRELFQLLSDEYRHLYGFVPFSDEQVQEYTRQYFTYLHPDFVPIVLDADGRMAAFGISMPSLAGALQKSRGRLFPFGFIRLLWALRHNDRAELYLVAVRSDFQGRGVNAVLIDRMIRTCNRYGIRVVESNPEQESNLRVQAQWKHFDSRQHKRRRTYIKLFDERG